MKPQSLTVVLISGILFGFGLTLSTMVDPNVVLGFLRGKDYGLLLVLGAAIAVTTVFYQVAPRQMKKPLFEETFNKQPVKWEKSTFIGAGVFGVGWGVSGVCPGPAIAGLGSGYTMLLWSVLGLLIGALAHGLFTTKDTA